MILLIDNYDSFTWNLYQYFCELGAEVLVKRNDELTLEEIATLQTKITPLSDGAGIEEVLCQGRFRQGKRLVPLAVRFYSQPGSGVTTTVGPPPSEPLKPLDEYAGKVLRARRRGLVA